MQVKVSVIVPCYNYAKYLPFALDSVLAQDMEHWECIVVDDGSGDETGRVAREYVHRMHGSNTCTSKTGAFRPRVIRA